MEAVIANHLFIFLKNEKGWVVFMVFYVNIKNVTLKRRRTA